MCEVITYGGWENLNIFNFDAFFSSRKPNQTPKTDNSKSSVDLHSQVLSADKESVDSNTTKLRRLYSIKNNKKSSISKNKLDQTIVRNIKNVEFLKQSLDVIKELYEKVDDGSDHNKLANLIAVNDKIEALIKNDDYKNIIKILSENSTFEETAFFKFTEDLHSQIHDLKYRIKVSKLEKKNELISDLKVKLTNIYKSYDTAKSKPFGVGNFDNLKLLQNEINDVLKNKKKRKLVKEFYNCDHTKETPLFKIKTFVENQLKMISLQKENDNFEVYKYDLFIGTIVDVFSISFGYDSIQAASEKNQESINKLSKQNDNLELDISLDTQFEQITKQYQDQISTLNSTQNSRGPNFGIGKMNKFYENIDAVSSEFESNDFINKAYQNKSPDFTKDVNLNDDFRNSIIKSSIDEKSSLKDDIFIHNISKDSIGRYQLQIFNQQHQNTLADIRKIMKILEKSADIKGLNTFDKGSIKYENELKKEYKTLLENEFQNLEGLELKDIAKCLLNHYINEEAVVNYGKNKSSFLEGLAQDFKDMQYKNSKKFQKKEKINSLMREVGDTLLSLEKQNYDVDWNSDYILEDLKNQKFDATIPSYKRVSKYNNYSSPLRKGLYPNEDIDLQSYNGKERQLAKKVQAGRKERYEKEWSPNLAKIKDLKRNIDTLNEEISGIDGFIENKEPQVELLNYFNKLNS